MAWNKIPVAQIPKPKSPSYLKWFLAIILSLFFLISFLYSITQNELSTQQKGINTLIAFSPLVLVLISFFGCLIIYSQKKNQYEFLESEKAYADKQWEQWGARSMSILDAVVLLPKKMTITYMLNHQSQHEASYHLPQPIDYLLENHTTSLTLLKIIQERITQLSSQHTLQIKYLTSKHETLAKEELISAWTLLFPSQAAPEFTVVSALSYQHLDDAIQHNNNTVELILIEQNHTSEQSAGLAALMITSDDIARSYHMTKMADVHRPMPITVEEDYQEALTLFCEIQIDSNSATRVFSDGKCPQNVLSALFQSDNKLPAISPNSLLDLAFFIGPTGNASSWLNLALAIQYVAQHRKTALTISQEPHDVFIGTITPSQST